MTEPSGCLNVIKHKTVIKPAAEALHHETVFELEYHNCLCGRKLEKMFYYVNNIKQKAVKN